MSSLRRIGRSRGRGGSMEPCVGTTGAVDHAEQRYEQVVEQHRPAREKSEVWIQTAADIGVGRSGRRIQSGHATIAHRGQDHRDHRDQDRVDRVALRVTHRDSENRDGRTRGDREDAIHDQIPNPKHAAQTWDRRSSRYGFGGVHRSDLCTCLLRNGAREGNWTLVTAIVILSGLKWPDSLGNFNRVAGGFLHYLHSTKLSEIWPICTARNARRSGMFSIWNPTGRSTTNRPACAPMIQKFGQGDHMTILEQFHRYNRE